MELLITGAFPCNEEQFRRIEALGYNITFVQEERTFLDIDVSKFEAVVCNALFLYNDISRFEKLKFIQLTSAGLDRVPLDHITAKGIRLCRAEKVYSIPMAEWVILKILEIYKQSKHFLEAQTNRRWDKRRDLRELYGKSAVIVGYGDVGAETAKRLKSFGVYTIGIGRRPRQSEFLDEYHDVANADNVLPKGDIVVLALPLTNETLHFMNRDRIDRLRDEAVLINVSRGGVIDEQALIGALENGKFSGVALDVFENEPLCETSPLWGFDRVIISPHNSFASENVLKRLFDMVYDNLRDVSSVLFRRTVR